MKVLVKRTYNCDRYCIGHLYVDGQYICDTIEDTDRGLDQSMSTEQISKIKVRNNTAIPTGKYDLTINVVSPKFQRYKYYMLYCQGKLPRILNVPYYDGILIHQGVDWRSTSGCIIVGYNKVKGKVVDSQDAFEKLYELLKKAKVNREKIEIEIVKNW